MKMKKQMLAAALLTTVCVVVRAEVAVIVHPSIGFNELSDDNISRLFLGKAKSFPNGEMAIPINQDEGSASRTKFQDTLVKKNASQYKAYWSQLVFTGKGTPPKDAGKDADVKKLIGSNPNMIGYIDAAQVDSSVKVVFKIP